MACPSSVPDFEQQIVDLHVDLLKFADLQLRNQTLSEYAVSEPVLTALTTPQAFEQRTQLKS